MGVWEREMKEELGSEKFERILIAVRRGHIGGDEMDTVATELGGTILGNHKRGLEDRGAPDQHEMKRILCDFYKEEGHAMTGEEMCQRLSEAFKAAEVPNPMVCQDNKETTIEELRSALYFVRAALKNEHMKITIGKDNLLASEEYLKTRKKRAKGTKSISSWITGILSRKTQNKKQMMKESESEVNDLSKKYGEYLKSKSENNLLKPQKDTCQLQWKLSEQRRERDLALKHAQELQNKCNQVEVPFLTELMSRLSRDEAYFQIAEILLNALKEAKETSSSSPLLPREFQELFSELQDEGAKKVRAEIRKDSGSITWDDADDPSPNNENNNNRNHKNDNNKDDNDNNNNSYNTNHKNPRLICPESGKRLQRAARCAVRMDSNKKDCCSANDRQQQPAKQRYAKITPHDLKAFTFIDLTLLCQQV